MEIKGKLVQLLALQTGQGKNGTWKKQECIIEIPGQYPKKICVAVWGDKIDESLLQIGNELNVSFDIESREYNGRWYTEVKAWKLEGTSQARASQMPPPNDMPDDFNMPSFDEADKLPF